MNTTENNVMGNNNEEVVNPNENQEKEQQDLDVTGENTVIEEKVEMVYDPDEKILEAIYESGKRDVLTNDLITAGFDSSRMASYTFSVGKYKLSRLLLVAPYKIEKIN